MPQNNRKNIDIDTLIADKIQQSLEQEIFLADKKIETISITDFSSLPENYTFDKCAVYAVFNRNTRQKTYLNGAQVESLIGLLADIRRNLLEKSSDSFTTGEYYVKFHCASIKEQP